MSVHYHLDDKREYLETYSNIVNQIAIIDKSFLEIEILKPILAATVLRGIYITQPCLTLTLSKKTNYTALVEMYPKLYKDLTSLSLEKFITFNYIYVHFLQIKFTS